MPSQLSSGISSTAKEEILGSSSTDPLTFGKSDYWAKTTTEKIFGSIKDELSVHESELGAKTKETPKERSIVDSELPEQPGDYLHFLTERILPSEDSPTSPSQIFALSHDSTSFVKVIDDGTVESFDRLYLPKDTQKIKDPLHIATAVAFGPLGEMGDVLALGSERGQMLILSMTNGRHFLPYNIITETILCMAISYNFFAFFIAGQSYGRHSVKVFTDVSKLDSPPMSVAVAHEVCSMSFTKTESFLVLGHRGLITVYSARLGKCQYWTKIETQSLDYPIWWCGMSNQNELFGLGKSTGKIWKGSLKPLSLARKIFRADSVRCTLTPQACEIPTKDIADAVVVWVGPPRGVAGGYNVMTIDKNGKIGWYPFSHF